MAMSTMKAITLSENGGIDVLQYTDVEKPVAGEGQVVVKNQYAGVSTGNYQAVMHSWQKLQLPGWE